MTRYEYRVVALPAGSTEPSGLNALGAKGWLVVTSHLSDNGMATFTLARELPPARTPIDKAFQ
jgi:hypothetical protein